MGDSIARWPSSENSPRKEKELEGYPEEGGKTNVSVCRTQREWPGGSQRKRAEVHLADWHDSSFLRRPTAADDFNREDHDPFSRRLLPAVTPRTIREWIVGCYAATGIQLTPDFIGAGA